MKKNNLGKLVAGFVVIAKKSVIQTVSQLVNNFSSYAKFGQYNVVVCVTEKYETT
ncbi:MAG: hypothetical protein ABID79_05170 [Elusimicrobiota bacterium]